MIMPCRILQLWNIAQVWYYTYIKANVSKDEVKHRTCAGSSNSAGVVPYGIIGSAIEHERIW